MSAPASVEHFVTVRADDAARVAEVMAALQEIERKLSCTATSLMKLGEKLFALAFPEPDDVMELARQLASAVRGGFTLRLWLDVDDNAALLPWEYLCLTEYAVGACQHEGYNIAKFQTPGSVPNEKTFLALHPNVSLVRQSGDPAAGGPLERIGKLRVLVVSAQPEGELWGPIAGLQAEVASIEQALRQLAESHVEVEVVDHATPDVLRYRVREFRPHVLHFAGHGAFPSLDDPGDGLAEPSLVLENGAGGHAYFGAAALRALCGEVGVQVVALNSCWGAKGSPRFLGLARTLTTPGGGRAVPVVVAHQMAVPQATASGFARPFYEHLVIGLPLEEGVRAFRRECVLASPTGVASPDWGIPVVHLGTRSTHLFRYERPDLYPLDFGELIREHVPIVGRQFVRDAIEECMTERDRGVFLLTAPPGIGKTAFLAQLCEDDPRRVYFFYRAAAGMTDPDDWVKSTHQALLGRYGIVLDKAITDRAELRTSLKQWLLPKVSQACAGSGRKELILLDALDESGRTSMDGRSALEVLPERLPPHVYLLVTSRPGPLAEACALRADCYPTYPLDPASEGNRDDAAAFCVRELRRTTDADEPTLTRLGAMLARKAEGNFLVLKLFFGRDALKGRPAVASIECEAADLTGDVKKEYERFFRRATEDVTNDREGMKLLNRVLGAFVTSRAPVTAEQVCEAFAVDVEDWEWALCRVAQFLSGGGLRQEERGVRTYRIYHETFREFLKDRLKTRLAEFNGKWADHAEQWRKLTEYARLYALRHLVSHLVAAAKSEAMQNAGERAYEALTDFAYLQERIGGVPGRPAADDVFGLLGDYVEALEAMPRREDLETLHRVIDGQGHWIKETPRMLVPLVYNALAWPGDGVGGKVKDFEGRHEGGHLRLLNRPARLSACIRTMTGHEGEVSSVAFSRDGSRIVSGSDDKTVKVWDAHSGRESLSLTGHTHWVDSVAFSPDGLRLVSGSWDNTAKVWDAHSGRELLGLAGHTKSVTSVAFSRDGSRIVSGSLDNTVKVWDAQSGSELRSLSGHTDGVYSVAFSRDGSRIVSGSDDKTVKVWDAHSGRESLSLTGHTHWVDSVAFSPDGLRVASGSRDNTVKLWDAHTGELIATFPCLDNVLALWHHPKQLNVFHVADAGAGTGVPNVYVLQLVQKSDTPVAALPLAAVSRTWSDTIRDRFGIVVGRLTALWRKGKTDA